MFIVTLTFSSQKTKAPQFMDAHNAWIQDGFSSGFFLLTGSLMPNAGGAVLAHNITRSDLEALVQNDPFVREDIVSASIAEVTPKRTDPRLDFLKA